MTTEMKVTISQGDVVINMPKDKTRIGMRISGGADSSMLAYMMAVYKRDYRPDILLFPMTVVHPLKAYQAIFAQKALDKITELTGVGFEPLDAYYPDYEEPYNFVGRQSIASDDWHAKRNIHAHVMGETMNPPLEVEQAEFIFSGGGRDLSRDGLVNDPDMLKRRVFRNIDKKGVAELYRHFGILEDLFPITRSCEEHTDDFSKHCDICWFCKERFWGFGRYV